MTDQKEKPNLQDLLKALNNGEAYPHQPEKITHVQTHISHVFIVPPFVYKLKKPVDFGFLDYSTLEKRREYCHREVELNRRLCDGVYLGVSGICYDEGKYFICDENDEQVVEYAVKMRKLEDQYFLHNIIEEGQLQREHLERVAKKLADFYNGQKKDDNLDKWGEISSIKVNTDENFEQTREFIGETIDRPSFEAIQYFTNQYFVSREALFRRRITDGRIVDGHGDLHLDHIHITPDEVRIYDCIEFNDRFRYGDLAADLAYFAMDLDFSECWQEERYFIDLMAAKLKDDDLKAILDFYKCYRAYVKGKVKSLQSAEEEVPANERKMAADKAENYFNLSLRYILMGSRPQVMIFMGRVGTGKSTLAGLLSKKLGIAHYSSDYLRKTMANIPVTERTPQEKIDEVYSGEMSRKTYDALKENMNARLEKGESVILDATFSGEDIRSEFISELEKRDTDFVFIEARASDTVLRQRLKKRDEGKEVISDARLEDFEMLDERYERPGELDKNCLVAVDTDQPLEQTLEQLFISLADRQIQGNKQDP